MLRHTATAASELMLAKTTARSSSLHGSSSTSCRVLACNRRLKSTRAVPGRSSYNTVLSNHRSGGRNIINGKPIAFHVRDLKIEQQQSILNSGFDNKNTGYSMAPSRRKTRSKRRKYKSDLIVVLDMDECLIHSQFLQPGADKKYAHQLQRSSANGSWGDARTTVDSFHITLPEGEHVHVNIRPGLLEFLEAVTSKYETHIFTAAVDVYANPVLDRFDPTGEKFAGRWYRESCQYDATLGAHVKALQAVEPWAGKLDRTVLVDNNPLSFVANPSNGILVKSFYNDPTDCSLPAVLDMLKELDDAGDVRPVLENRFGLTEGLKKFTKQPETALAAA